MSSVELARRLGTRQPTAWLIKHKLMAAMAAREAEKPKLAGRVEMDDAYLGGQRAGGKRGRGAAGKTPFVAAVETTAERKPRRLRLTVVKGFRRRRSRRWPSATSPPAATWSATACPAGTAVGEAGCDHFPMVTGSGRTRPSGSPLPGSTTALGNIKTALAGTYHHVSAKHAQRYLYQLVVAAIERPSPALVWPRRTS